MIFQTDKQIQKKMPSESANPSDLYVPLTSDKGLCGGINSNIVREVKGLMKEHPDKSKVKILCIGDKGASALSRPFPE